MQYQDVNLSSPLKYHIPPIFQCHVCKFWVCLSDIRHYYLHPAQTVNIQFCVNIHHPYQLIFRMINVSIVVIPDGSKITYLCKGFDIFNHQHHVWWAWVWLLSKRHHQFVMICEVEAWLVMLITMNPIFRKCSRLLHEKW